MEKKKVREDMERDKIESKGAMVVVTVKGISEFNDRYVILASY
jgi:hypothetical protein